MMFTKIIQNHIDCMSQLAEMAPAIESAAARLSGVVKNGGCIFVCGNGGSAADSQHFAAELVGRFEKERAALPSVALTTDTSIITAVANDYAYDDIFVRQLAGLASEKDALLGLSTSGNSENVLRACNLAMEKKMACVGLLGGNGGKLRERVEIPLVMPSANTARIQEMHILILHFFAMMIESDAMGERR
ncbi:MAG: SIS domain-containing protein [Thermodesulfobacteriota bacterium]|nr:SIS domain-containing protein [Thermodesulfobacteriota bacterium]